MRHLNEAFNVAIPMPGLERDFEKFMKDKLLGKMVEAQEPLLVRIIIFTANDTSTFLLFNMRYM